MQKLKRRSWFAAIVLLLLVAWLVWRQWPESSPVPESARDRAGDNTGSSGRNGDAGDVLRFSPGMTDDQMWDAVIRDTYGDIELAGTVVDEEGQPLSGVMLYVTAAHAPERDRPGSGEVEAVRLETLADGSFSVAFKQAAGANFMLAKEGYETIDVKYSLMGKDQRVQVDADGNRSLRLPKEKIVMAANPGGDSISDNTFTLEYRADSRSGYIVRWKELTNGKSGNKALRCVPWSSSVADCEALPPHSIVLTCKIEDGKFVFQAPENDLDRVRGYGQKFGYIVDGVLRMSSSEDGFLFHMDAEDSTAEITELRRMRLAPQEGYQQVLLIPNKAASRLFYFRIDGRYGKGCMTRATAESEILLRATIHFNLQYDGSRHLHMNR